MAFTVSRSQIVKVGVKLQAAEGTPVVPTGATDDLLCFTNANPGEQLTELATFRPFTGTFTKPAGFTGVQLGSVNIEFLMGGSGSAGTWAVNGFAAKMALFMASGMALYDPAGSAAYLRLQPASITQLTTFGASTPFSGCATVYVEMDGFLHQIPNTWGNMVMTGAPNTGWVCQFTGQGTYVAPTVAAYSGYTAIGAPTPTAFRNVALTVTGSGSGAYTPVCHQWRVDFGNDIQRITDVNQSSGMKGFLFADRNPTLSLVLAADKDGSAAESYDEFYADSAAGTTHRVTFTHGTTPNAVTFTAPACQITSITKGDDSKHRTLTVNYNIVNSTAEADFTMVIQ